MLRRTLVLGAVIGALAPMAHADNTRGDSDAVSEWIGRVSWNDAIIFYSWTIEPSGAFGSGRLGRGGGGGGAWSLKGPRLTLKYDNGVRYEGTLSGDAYAGTAYTADGAALGTFWMERAAPHAISDQ